MIYLSSVEGFSALVCIDPCCIGTDDEGEEHALVVAMPCSSSCSASVTESPPAEFALAIDAPTDALLVCVSSVEVPTHAAKLLLLEVAPSNHVGDAAPLLNALSAPPMKERGVVRPLPME